MIITNISNITYNEVMPDGNAVRGNAESNSVKTEILSYNVPKIIRSDKSFVREGENVQNTIIITNNSSTKLFYNFLFLPQHVGASYVPGSVRINGVAYQEYDVAKGFPLPDLSPAETVIVEYEVKADNKTTQLTHFATFEYSVNDPVRGKVNYSEKTDVISLKVISEKLSIAKSVDKAFAIKGEILHYKITIVNIGTVTKSDLIFRDPIPDGTTFVVSSIRIDGTIYSAYNPQKGFVLRSLAPGAATAIEFDVKVN